MGVGPSRTSCSHCGKQKGHTRNQAGGMKKLF